MSAIIGSLVNCPNVQERLITQFTEFVPTDTQDAIGVTKFLLSPINTNNTLQRQINPGNGKRRTVELRYDQRGTAAQVSSGALQSCAGGDEYGECVVEYSIDPATDGKNLKWSLTNATLQERCEDDAFWVARTIQKSMDNLEREINKSVITTVGANFGKFVSTGASAPVNVKTLKDGTTEYNPRLVSGVRREFRDMNYSGAPVVFGDGLLADWFEDTLVTCCANDGEQISALLAAKPIGFMHDHHVEDIIGADEFIAIVPGAVQLLTYHEFEGDFLTINDGTYTQGTLVNPKTGMKYDYLSKFDCGVWSFQLKVAFKPVVLPNDIAQSGDKMNGVNFVQNFKVVNA